MFQEPERAARGLPTAAIAIAGVVVLVVIALLLMLGRRNRPAATTAGVAIGSAAYAPQVVLSDVQMSESTSFSGSKETFIDGRIANNGASTVTAAMVQVSFPSDDGAPQQETTPVSLIRTRQPYIDVQPMTAAPLAPGASAQFRLTFDDIRPDWNQQVPGLRVVRVSTR